MSGTNQADTLRPEDYRLRYLELKNRARESGGLRLAAHQADNPKNLPKAAIVAEETIPGGWYWTERLPRGTTLRIVNDDATAGVSAVFWNADDTSERYNAGDTVKVQWTARLSQGRLLLSDMGRVLASITADTCGAHDSVVGGSTRASDFHKYGGAEGSDAAPRNTRDNFILAAGKHGMSVRDVGPCITFFAPVRTDAKGRFVWDDGAVKPGDYVDLRAEMDLLVALSNCPHPLSPGASWAPRPVRAIIWRSPTAGPDDFCRIATEEAVRAFENTDAYNRA